VLTGYFAGTSVGDRFPNGGTNTITVGSATVAKAPLNYLQIWDEDIFYAAGLGTSICSWEQKMVKPLKCTPDMSVFSLSADAPMLGGSLNARQLLNTASDLIRYSTAELVALLPLCCPSSPTPYVPRGAFQGDPVCVSSEQAMEVMTDNNAAAAGTSYSSNYTDSSYYTGATPTPVPSIPNAIVPYGICNTSLGILSDPQFYRQAYMGDYVCVLLNEANRISNDNAAFLTRAHFCGALTSPFPSQLPPLPVLPGLPLPNIPLPIPPGPLLGPGN
jgi:hypothetical protein